MGSCAALCLLNSREQFPARRYAPFVIGACYLIGLGVLASALRVQYGFPLDDSYIHQTIARNFAQTGVVGFHAGQPSPGSTSILWTCIQAGNSSVLHLDPVIFNLLLSAVLLPLIGAMLFVLASRDGLSTGASIALAVAPAFSGNFVWLGVIGMEHLLLVALTLVAVLLWFRQGRRSAMATGGVLGLVILTRPEAIVLAPVFLLSLRPARRRGRDVLLAGLLWSIGVLAELAANFYATARLRPGTLDGRSWAYFHSTGGPHSLSSVLQFLGNWLLRPSMEFSALISGPRFDVIVLFFVVTTFTLIGAGVLLRQTGPRLRLLVLLAITHFLFFIVMFPTIGQGCRYQPLSLLFLLPCLYLGVSASLRLVYPARAELLAAIFLLLAGSASLLSWRLVTVYAIGQINSTHGRASQWLKSAAPGSVAAYDIGRISYTLRNRNVIDLGGLTDPDIVPYMNAGHVGDYPPLRNAAFVVLPGDSFPSALGIHMTSNPAAEFCAPHARWLISAFYTDNAAGCQLVYKVTDGAR